MISRARIVIGEKPSGQLVPLHASFDAVAALTAFRAAQTPEFVEVALIEHSVITRITRPSKVVATAKPEPPAPPPIHKKKAHEKS